MPSEDEIRSAIALLERRLSNGWTVPVGDGQKYGNPWQINVVVSTLAHSI